MKEELKSLFAEIVGLNNVIDDPALFGPYTDDFTDHYVSKPLAVVRPSTTEQVSKIVKLCAQYNVPIVTQGGNTSLTGAATTYRPDAEIVLSMTKMKNVIDADPLSDTLTVQAGMTLAEVHEAAESVNRFFPLSFAAEGNATIGGCCACNAGGVAVLRYGTTRDLVLGVEVVLPDGRIYNGLRRLRKDNTGYDFKDLFLGSEGTIGIITAVVLKLFPAAIERVKKYLPDIEVPPLSDSPWKVLVELSLEKKPQESMMEHILEGAFEDGEITDAAIASSLQDSHTFWHVRESIPLADRTAGGSIHSDVSLPISLIPEFVEETSAMLLSAYPWLGLSIYGHLGDGNLHFNFVSPEDPGATYRNEEGIREILYSQVNKFEGSISAEHGIGMLKLDHNYQFKDPLEIEMMRKIKNAFDPKGIMNPGKLLKTE